MTFIKYFFIGCLWMGSVVSLASSTTPMTITNQAQVTFVFARQAINTVAVIDDPIDQVMGDPKEARIERDMTGQLYITVNTIDHPITLFFRTRQGHHFSGVIEIDPSLKKGQTSLVQFSNSKASSNLKKRKVKMKKADASSLLPLFLNHRIPNSCHRIGFSRGENVSVPHSKVLFQLKDIWQCSTQQVNVYALHNLSRSDFIFNPHQFSVSNFKKSSAMQPHLKPDQSTWVFLVLDKGSAHV